MITPNKFRVNEAWIAVRINEEFILFQDEPYDIYVLVDADSCFVFGHVFSRVVDEAPQENDVRDLFQAAFRTKNQWPKILILSGNSPSDYVFKKFAERLGFLIQTFGPIELEPILGPLKEFFASSFVRKPK